MNKQEIFTKVWNGLKAQDFKRSVDVREHTCRYRGTYGMKCAAGHLIADEHYSPSMEGSIISEDEAVEDALVASGVSRKHITFVEALQKIHDDAADMRESLMRYADQHRLVVPDGEENVPR